MENILLVEDDLVLGTGIQYALTKDNFDVKVARTIAEGYRIFVSQPFALMLLDIMLPDGSGYDLCRKIRQESTVPIIFLTACEEEVNVVQGLELGGDDYITKPFRVRELIARIKAALRRNSSEISNVSTTLKSGDILLHLLETKAFQNGRELNLTPVEYKLLAVLMQNPRQTLTREQILEKLWDVAGEFVNDNTLSVYIRRLREKVERDPSNPEYIITVRGLGYKWDRLNERVL